MFTWMFHLTCAILLSNPANMTKLSFWTVITTSQCFEGRIKEDFPDRSPLWKLVRLTRNQNGVHEYKGDKQLDDWMEISQRPLGNTQRGKMNRFGSGRNMGSLYDGLGNLPYRKNENCFGCLSVLLLVVFLIAVQKAAFHSKRVWEV
mgnify:CR=1 FL=1